MRECDPMLREVEMQKKKEVKIDKIISSALMSSFIVLTFQYLILISFNLLETSYAPLIQTISKVMVGLIFVITLPFVLRRNLKIFMIIYGFGIILFSYNFLVFPENHAYMIHLMFPFFFVALPSFIYVVSINNLEVFSEVTAKAALLIFALGTFLGILIFTGNSSVGVYSMALSYYMLLPALLFLGKVFDKGSIIFTIYFIIALIVILALGSRGALLCITVYAILRVVSPRQRISMSKVFIYIVTMITLILGFLYYKNILLFISKLFLEYGIQSRTIYLLLQDELYLSGRDSIIQSVWSEIIQSPLLGIGLAGDSRISGGSYVHNFIIEIMGNFGIPIGILLLCILMSIVFTTLRFSKDYNLIALWLCLGLVHLMVSGSYIIDIKFWILLGILYKTIHLNRSYEIKGGLK